MSKIEEFAFKAPVSRSWFAKLGRFIYEHRGWTIAIWAILIGVSLIATPALESALKETGAVYEAGEAYQTEQFLQKELNVIPDALTLVFQRRSNSQINPIEVTSLLNQIRRLSAVRSVVENPQYRSGDGQTQYSMIQLQVKEREADRAIDRIEQILTQQSSSSFQTFLTGKPIVDRAVQQISKADLGRIELLILPLTLIALLIVFGSVVAAAMPVAMGVTTVSVTFGLLYLVTLNLSVSVFALNLTTMLGLGLGIDYSLLIVNRFREELQSNPVEQALIQTLETAGETVFFSGLTVCIGLVCLMLFPILLLQSLGIAGAIVVLLSVMSALTLLPALLGFVGHRISARQSSQSRLAAHQIWATIGRIVTRHSLVATSIVLVIVTGLTSPFLAARFGLGNSDILPLSAPAREGIELLQRSFVPGETSPIFLAIRTQTPKDPILSDQHIATLYNLVTQLEKNPRIASITSLVNLNAQFTLENYQKLYRSPASISDPTIANTVKQLSSASTALILIKSHTVSNDAASRSLIKELRSLKMQGLQVRVGGQGAKELDVIEVVRQRLPIAFVALIAATFIMLYILLRSIVLPLKAIVMNLLSIGASFGALVFIFQQGHFQTWLNFTPVGYLDILLPIVLFCVLFGLSMDYEVFLLTRIKEAYDRCGDNSKSIIIGLENTGSIITSAAFLMIIVTSSFALTSLIFVKALGLGSAIAIVIDATLIRAILVPAMMQLMGRWNWWSPRIY
ncbi:MMPL family transporter [Phormidesmis priestleyi]